MEAQRSLAARVERVCSEMLLICMGLLMIAMAFSWRLGTQANQIDHQLYHLSENVKGIHKTIARMEAELR